MPYTRDMTQSMWKEKKDGSGLSCTKGCTDAKTKGFELI